MAGKQELLSLSWTVQGMSQCGRCGQTVEELQSPSGTSAFVDADGTLHCRELGTCDPQQRGASESETGLAPARGPAGPFS